MTDTVRHAESGTAGWREAARTIGAAQLDHGDMYELGAELSETLRAIEQVTESLRNQVLRYDQGRRLRDDEGDRPEFRLADAAAGLAATGRALTAAERVLQRYWSAIGHIGVDTTSTED